MAIEHVAGKDNAVTDTLSRIVIGNIYIQMGLDYHTLVLAQQGDQYTLFHLTLQPASTFEISLWVLAIPRSFGTFPLGHQGP